MTSAWKLIAETFLTCIYPADKIFVHALAILAYPILVVNCAINPNIYLILSRKFRNELKNMIDSLIRKFRRPNTSRQPAGRNCANGRQGNVPTQTTIASAQKSFNLSNSSQSEKPGFYRKVGTSHRNNFTGHASSISVSKV